MQYLRRVSDGLGGKFLQNQRALADAIQIVRFNNQETLDSWDTQSDSQLGGLSTINWTFRDRPARGSIDDLGDDSTDDEQTTTNEPTTSNDTTNQGQPTGFAEFSGELSMEVTEEMQKRGTIRSGFCAVASPLFKNPMDLSFHGGIALRVAGDNRNYVFNLSPVGFGEDRLLQCTFQAQPEWSIVQIPFTRFVKTWKGHIEDHQKLEPLDVENIHRIGILMAERKSGPFTLCIDWIRVLPAKDFAQRYLLDSGFDNGVL